MRITYLNPTVLIRRPISELAHLLAKEGHKITIITPKTKKQDTKNLHHTKLLDHKNITIKEFSAINPPIEFEWPIPTNQEFNKIIKEAIKESDVIHTWTIHYLPILATLIKNKKTKIIITLDTLPGYTFKTGIIYDTLFKIHTKTIGKWMLKKANEITVYGKEIAEELAKNKIIKKVKIIPTGIIPRKVKKADIKKIIKNKGLNPEKKIVTFVGLTTKRKGIDLVIETAKKVKEANFLIIGEGPKRKKYEKKAPKNMIFLGKRKDVLEIIKASDIFFLPSRGEGLPGVIYEAMLVGTPVVATKIPCITTQIEHEKQGILVKYEDVEGYAKAIKQIINNEKKRKKMSSEAKKRIKKFLWDEIIKEYKGIYGIK